MGLDPRLAQEIIAAVDARFHQLQRGMPYTLYGVVATVDAVNHKASVYLSGDTTASAGFSWQTGLEPAVGAKVRVVIDPRGDRYIDAVVDPRLSVVTVDKVRIPNTGDAQVGADLHGLQVGPDSGVNLAIDGNEVMARNNGALAELFLGNDGGGVRIGRNGAATAADGLEIGPGQRPIYDDGTDLNVKPNSLDAYSLKAFEADNARNGNSALENYPNGFSFFTITSSTDAGWPVADGRGLVVTFRDGSSGAGSQLWFQRPSIGNTAYRRNWNSNTSAWRAWVAF